MWCGRQSCHNQFPHFKATSSIEFHSPKCQIHGTTSSHFTWRCAAATAIVQNAGRTSRKQGITVGAESVDKEASLSEVIGIDHARLKRLVISHPALLHASPKQLVPRLMRLSEVLKSPIEQVLILVSRAPGVLSSSPTIFLEKAVEMEVALGLRKETILCLLSMQPEFLEIPTKRLANRCFQLAMLLNVSLFAALKALTRLPPSSLFELFGLRPTSIAMRHAQLKEMLQVSVGVPGIPLPDDPTIADDGGIAFTPLLMRRPLPGALKALSPRDRHEALRSLKSAAHIIGAASRAASRLPRRPSCASALILKCPQLLLMSPEELLATHRALLSILQVPHARLAALLSRCPTLLLHPASDIQHTWACLLQCLSLPRAGLVSRLLQQPQLLEVPGEDVEGRVSALQTNLELERYEVVRMLRNHIQLLRADPAAVGRKMRFLSALFGISLEAVNQSVRLQPGLLTLSLEMLRRKCEGLHLVLLPELYQHHSLDRNRVANSPSLKEFSMPASAHTSAGTSHRNLPTAKMLDTNTVRNVMTPSPHSGLPSYLSSSVANHVVHTSCMSPSSNSPSLSPKPSQCHPCISHIINHHPTLLTLSTKTLCHKLGGLSLYFGIEERLFRRVVLDHPLLLTTSTQNLRYKCSELQFILGISSRAARFLILAHPSVALTAHCSTIKRSLLAACRQHIQPGSTVMCQESRNVSVQGRNVRLGSESALVSSEDSSAGIEEEECSVSITADMEMLEARLSSFVMRCSLTYLSRILSSLV
ncbi:hypothetical protein CEUSTIGMA_g4917.t1 [Chlamydomonas eustigma]|uniref:Uncharacterized protein n=1 Tax=Chlamydomonas eustigma TaxID=1157962 RepID=A0A250X314_9CHLO|nr:hypothetical protein CEUSTIGMA_g4917.t1 [Chlamydomonas eustigma]|eukprot:GAX77473.1 hypothetical protein CEUSTIGMA_g4917.t1 [Chlamydomonas eustigma]